jgi:hypothetical protein
MNSWLPLPRPLKEIAAKYGAKAEHIVEHAADLDL